MATDCSHCGCYCLECCDDFKCEDEDGCPTCGCGVKKTSDEEEGEDVAA
jgi:hypothetical protein